MDLHHVPGVRDQPQTVPRRLVGDLQPLGHTAEPGHVGLDHAERVRGHEAGERVVRVEALPAATSTVLTACSRWCAPRSSACTGSSIQSSSASARTGMIRCAVAEIPSLIGVGHHRDVRSDRRPYGAHPGRVLTPVGLTDLDLHPSPAAVDQRTEVADHLRDTQIQPAAVGVVRLDRVGRTSEQAPERHPGTLSGEIPQGDVDHRQGHVDDAGSADPVRRQPIEPFPGAEDVLGRSADQRGCVVLVDDVAEQLGPQWTPEIPVPTRPSAVRISTTGTIQDFSAAVESASGCRSGTASA